MAPSDQQEIGIASLRSLSKTYKERAADARAVGDYLKRQADSAFWQSEAAQKFKTNMGEFQRVLASYEARFTSFATELDNRIRALEESGNR